MKPPQFLHLLYLASSLAAGLGLLIPFVALALVLVYGFGHVPTLRLFLGIMALTALAGALPRGMRLGQTLRLGMLKVSGTVVQQSESPLRFWTWVAIDGFFFILNLAVAGLFAWVTLRSSA